MIAHVATIDNGETEDAPFVFSPRISEDGAQITRPPKGKLLRNFRSVFCCLAPNVALNGMAADNGSGLSSPMVYPSDDSVDFIIGEPREEDRDKKTLVLDLDETLVHSSFQKVHPPDITIPVEIDGRLVDVYVQKRPGLDEFLRHVCGKFEVVIFTASLSKYANPLLDVLDPEGNVRWRLFRDACSTHKGTYVKDLSRLGRELSQTVIVDNSPLSYIFQPGNALPITGFLGDPNDQALSELMPVLDELAQAEDVRACIKQLLDVELAEGDVAVPIVE